MDLRDLDRGALGLRRLRALVLNLPRDAATVRAQLGDSSEWSTESELLASLIELTHAGLRAQAGKAATSIAPLHIPRPYEQHERRQSTPNEIQAFLKGTTT